MRKIVAVIDIGSNSARMAIFGRTSRFGFSLIFETKSKVRISEGSYENNGILQDEPMQRAMQAVYDFSLIAKNYNATKLLCVATSAVRDAPNKNEFVSMIKKKTKVQIKVIDGIKEAFYGAVACSNLLHKKSGITIDIGGGSTECALIENGKIKELVSLNIGTIRIKELFFKQNQKPNIKEAKKFIKDEIKKLPSTFKSKDILGIGGSIRALSKLIMKKQNYKIDTIHGFEFKVKDYMQYFKDIYTSNLTQLKDFQIPADREDNIRQGALILSMILEHFNTECVTTSGVGVREGVFLSDLLRNQNFAFPKGFNPSYRSLLDRFMINKKIQNIVKRNATLLFHTLESKHNIDRKFLFHLENAAGLTKIGNALGFYLAHKHSAYFVINALSYGYSHTDKAIISLLLKYNGKKIPNNEEILHINNLTIELIVLQWLSFILSMAEILSLSNKVVECDFKNDTLYIYSDFYLLKEKISILHRPKPIKIEFIKK